MSVGNGHGTAAEREKCAWSDDGDVGLARGCGLVRKKWVVDGNSSLEVSENDKEKCYSNGGDDYGLMGLKTFDFDS